MSCKKEVDKDIWGEENEFVAF